MARRHLPTRIRARVRHSGGPRPGPHCPARRRNPPCEGRRCHRSPNGDLRCAAGSARAARHARDAIAGAAHPPAGRVPRSARRRGVGIRVCCGRLASALACAGDCRVSRPRAPSRWRQPDARVAGRYGSSARCCTCAHARADSICAYRSRAGFRRTIRRARASARRPSPGPISADGIAGRSKTEDRRRKKEVQVHPFRLVWCFRFSFPPSVFRLPSFRWACVGERLAEGATGERGGY